MATSLTPTASASRLPFATTPAEKYADWSAADFDVKAWVNRELAAARDDAAGARGRPGTEGARDGATSAVAQQELDGFATTVLEEEGAKDASDKAAAGTHGRPGAPLSSEQLASGLVTRLQSMASELSGNIDKVGRWEVARAPQPSGP